MTMRVDMIATETRKAFFISNIQQFEI